METEPQARASFMQQYSRKQWLWCVTGCMLGAAVPAGFGMYGLWITWSQAAELPPGTGQCGMGALGSLVLIIVVAPICAALGVAEGCLVAAFCR